MLSVVELTAWVVTASGVAGRVVRATGGQPAGLVTAEDVAWLAAHLRVVVAASSAVWAGRGMTLSQLTVLHLISALAPGDSDRLGSGSGYPTAGDLRDGRSVDPRGAGVQHTGPAGSSTCPADGYR
jgi:hypothetical protein